MPNAPEPPIAILSSGHSIVIEEVMLFPEVEVAKLASLRAQAAKLLGGTSSGIGFIGSPTWAIGGALALGFLEGLANNSMKSQAATILQEAAATHARLIMSGAFFEYTDVTGIHLPTPLSWCANMTESVTVKIPGKEIRAGVFARITGPEEERITERTTQYVHLDQEFIVVRNASGSIHVKWSDVSAFRAGIVPVKPAPASTTFYTTAELAAQKRRQFTDPTQPS